MLDITKINKRIGVIVAAGGKGFRFGRNKLFEKIKDIPVFLYSLKLFSKYTLDGQLILVVSEEEHENYYQQILTYYPSILNKVTIINGGKTRQESVFNGIQALSAMTDLVVVHDAARPFLSENVFEGCLRLALDKGNATVAHSIVDTIKQVDQNGKVIQSIPRETLRAVETPQIFPYLLLKDALKKILELKFIATDETSAMNMIYQNYPIYLFEHQENNLKITFPKDL